MAWAKERMRERKSSLWFFSFKVKRKQCKGQANRTTVDDRDKKNPQPREKNKLILKYGIKRATKNTCNTRAAQNIITTESSKRNLSTFIKSVLMWLLGNCWIARKIYSVKRVKERVNWIAYSSIDTHMRSGLLMCASSCIHMCTDAIYVVKLVCSSESETRTSKESNNTTWKDESVFGSMQTQPSTSWA